MGTNKPVNKLLLTLSLLFNTWLLFAQNSSHKIDSLLEKVYKTDEPGASVLIQKKGKIIFQKSYGIANLQTKEKINFHSNFNVGSLTKQFTAFAILQLAKEKKLSVEDRLIRFFPDFNKKLGNEITVQELLTHSSGIIDHYAYVDTNRVKHASDRDVLNAVKNLDSTYFVPGMQYRYSNTAYCLLALIIEKISGMPYAAYIKKNIFEPLGMDHAQVFGLGSPIENQVRGYDIDEKGSFKKLDAEESIFFSTEGDGGVYCSSEDYSKWFRALQSGKLLGKKWIAEARSPQFPVDKPKQLYYGFGWFINENTNETAVYHTGSNGGFRAISFSIPSQDYLVVIFSNRTGIDLEKLVIEINKILRVGGNSYTKIDQLESFNNSSLIFAPCKETI
jgi:D-alanyl-D-alanine carboxypeptidase